MKISLNWIRDYIKADIDPVDLARQMTMHIVEVEDVITTGIPPSVVIGEIIESKSHPNSDQLQVAQVKISADKILQIVYGGVAVKAGDKVPVATAGTCLPAVNLTVGERSLRGVASQGMICAQDELGIGKDHSRVMVLEKGEVGQRVAEALSIPGDTVLEIENKSIPHRPDLMGHVGMAREIGAIMGTPAVIPAPAPLDDAKLPDLKVSVPAQDAVPRYDAVMLEVNVGSSPDWLRARLASLGIPAINNVVDITNYVMFDSGEPLHAFDADKIKLPITVRLAQAGEKITTIDSKERELKATHLVIADTDRPIAIAGIMGGKASEVTSETKRVVLEAAVFYGPGVWKTSREIGLTTDASIRFSKKALDPNIVDYALPKAVEMLKELAGAKIISNRYSHYPRPVQHWTVDLDFNRARKFIGAEIVDEEIRKILRNLGLEVGEGSAITIPTYRTDLTGPEDLYEEIARTYGYDRIPKKLPVGELRPATENVELHWERVAREALTTAGQSEVYTYSFNDRKTIEQLGLPLQDHLKVMNALSPENEYMRASLIPNLLGVVRLNEANFNKFGIFELGHVYYEGEDKKTIEERMLCGMLIMPGEDLFKHAKGDFEYLAMRLGIPRKSLKYRPLETGNATFHPGQAALVEAFGEAIGYVGRIHPQVLRSLGIKNEVGFFDINFEKLSVAATVIKGFVHISEYPSVARDLTLTMDEKVSNEDVEWAMQEAGGDLIKQLDLIDIYRDVAKVGEGKKAMTYRIIYQSHAKTLTDAEVEKVHSRVIEAAGRVAKG